MKYGILDKTQIGTQHVNARRQDISDVEYNWWIQHHLNTYTSYSFE